jgi:hypothetical protein
LAERNCLQRLKIFRRIEFIPPGVSPQKTRKKKREPIQAPALNSEKMSGDGTAVIPDYNLTCVPEETQG